jgi:hypothetical protein
MASSPIAQAGWKKRVSANAAGALLLFTLLHLLCFAAASQGAGPVRLIGLLLPVAMAVLLAARFEAHWYGRGDAGFLRAAACLWIGAACLPFLWSGAYLLVS